MLAIDGDGVEAAIVRVVKFSTIGAIALAPANEGGALKARDAMADDPFRYIYSSAGGLKKLKARQIRIDPLGRVFDPGPRERSEEHTSELQSLMRISYAVFCLKKKKTTTKNK